MSSGSPYGRGEWQEQALHVPNINTQLENSTKRSTRKNLEVVSEHKELDDVRVDCISHNNQPKIVSTSRGTMSLTPRSWTNY